MPVFDADNPGKPSLDPPEDKDAAEVQDAANAYLNALIRGTREEMEEAGRRWDEMTKRKDKENKGK